MSKDKKRKFQAIFQKNQAISNPVVNIIHSDEGTYHHILKKDLIKVFILTLFIIAVYIGLFLVDQKTGNITHFAEQISSYVLK